jgi:hypothetical protein
MIFQADFKRSLHLIGYIVRKQFLSMLTLHRRIQYENQTAQRLRRLVSRSCEAATGSGKALAISTRA